MKTGSLSMRLGLTVSLMGAVEGLACLLPQCAGRGEIGGGHLLRLGDELVASGEFGGIDVSSHGAAASS